MLRWRLNVDNRGGVLTGNNNNHNNNIGNKNNKRRCLGSGSKINVGSGSGALPGKRWRGAPRLRPAKRCPRLIGGSYKYTCTNTQIHIYKYKLPNCLMNNTLWYQLYPLTGKSISLYTRHQRFRWPMFRICLQGPGKDRAIYCDITNTSYVKQI